jgi:hypothetical protein
MKIDKRFYTLKEMEELKKKPKFTPLVKNESISTSIKIDNKFRKESLWIIKKKK